MSKFYVYVNLSHTPAISWYFYITKSLKLLKVEITITFLNFVGMLLL